MPGNLSFLILPLTLTSLWCNLWLGTWATCTLNLHRTHANASLMPGTYRIAVQHWLRASLGSVGCRTSFSETVMKLLGHLHVLSSHWMQAKSESKSSSLVQILWALCINENPQTAWGTWGSQKRNEGTVLYVCPFCEYWMEGAVGPILPLGQEKVVRKSLLQRWICGFLSAI